MSKFTRTDNVGNRSNNSHLSSIIEKRCSRRDLLQSSVQLATVTMLGGAVGSLSGCHNDSVSSLKNIKQIKLGFDSITGSLTDGVVVPTGYVAHVLIPWGTPLNDSAPDWRADLDITSGHQLNSVGMHHDGMYHFPLSETTASEEFIMAVNHEYIDTDALWKWDKSQHNNQDFDHASDGGYAQPRDAEQVRTEINAHGVTIVHIRKNSNNRWEPVKSSPYNRRLTSATPVRLSGPVAGSDYVKTKYSPDGTQTRGTNSNCACGYTPWGTYLSCEENWPDYFRMGDGDNGKHDFDYEYVNSDDKRLLVGQEHGRDNHSRGTYQWYNAAGASDEDNGEFARWYPFSTISVDSNHKPISNDPTQDFRNETRTFGYVVEIDPYTNTKAVKRTRLGRFRHENCWPGKLIAGEPVVYYMGHDSLSEYLYRFVSEKRWDPADANRPGEQYDRLSIGDKYLDQGTLYVAKFNDDGTGKWLALNPDSITKNNQTLSDELNLNADDLAGVIINTCDAADLMGATSMDRTEWGTVDPESGRFYVSCTNNWRRRENTQTFTNGGTDINALGVGPDEVLPDAVNPRFYSDGANKGDTPNGNEAGHIVTLLDKNVGSTDFTWDIFVFGAGANDQSNPSGLTELNQFGQPDGLWYDDRGNGEGILWIETDNGYDPVESYTNNQLLAVIPSLVSKDNAAGQSSPIVNPGNQEQLKRFLVSPNGCEVTGIFMVPDKTSLFINIQHPGNWPSSDDATEVTNGTVRPRSSTVVIQKEDGGQIGV